MAAEQRQLLEDREALREREQNLHEYEARLRDLQAEIERNRSKPAQLDATKSRVTPSIFHREPDEVQSAESPDLQAAWEKLHRARELLDAEQAHAREDRLALREWEMALQRREAALAAREEALAQREAAAAATNASPSVAFPSEAAPPSALATLSRAPFDLARRMLGKRTE